MIDFRVAGPEDAVTIASLHTASWRSTYRGMFRDEYLDRDVVADRLAVWEGRLRAPQEHQLVLLALEDTQVCGFACVLGREDPIWGSRLDNLHVVPALKGKGLGTKLIHRASVWTHERLPGEGLFLWVLEANTPARRFYEKLGGEKREHAFLPAPGGGTVPEYRYVWRDVEALCRITAHAG